MDFIFFAKIYETFTGLTNQIFAFITAIIIAHKSNKKVVVFDKFLNGIENINNTTPISQVFDFVKMNQFLTTKYGICIYDKNKSSVKIESIKYGLDADKNFIDLTSEIINHHKTLDKVNINSIKGDPYPNQAKQLFVTWNIGNGDLYTQTFKEQNNFIENARGLDLSPSFDNSKYNFTFAWINTHNQSMFEDILVNLHFNSFFTDKLNEFKKDIPANQKINVIHLRVENDALTHWSRQNKMSVKHVFNSKIY